MTRFFFVRRFIFLPLLLAVLCGYVCSATAGTVAQAASAVPNHKSWKVVSSPNAGGFRHNPLLGVATDTPSDAWAVTSSKNEQYKTFTEFNC